MAKEISSEHADRADREDVPGISDAYDKVGNLTRKTEADGNVTYGYDEREYRG